MGDREPDFVIRLGSGSGPRPSEEAGEIEGSVMGGSGARGSADARGSSRVAAAGRGVSDAADIAKARIWFLENCMSLIIGRLLL